MKRMEPIAPRREIKYQAVADRIGGMVEGGTFAPGTRIPSVRMLSRQLKVSITTVMEAYRVLEDQGVIEARPQSGYFVRKPGFRNAPEPEIRLPERDAASASIDEQIEIIIRDRHKPARVDLGAAIPSGPLLPTVKLNRALLAVARETHTAGTAYDSPAGCEQLRIQIARRALNAGCALAPSEIVTTSGCQQALTLCLLAVCRPGDTVAVESPTYHGVLQAIEMLGLKTVEVGTYPRQGMCIDLLTEALDEHPISAVIMMPNFNNPLGSLMPDHKKEMLVNLLAERDIPLIEDDIYGDLHYGPDRPKCAKAYDRSGRVLLCSSFSKTVAPGYRVGWTAPGRYRNKVEKMKFANSVCVATLPQLAVAEFLSNGGYDHHLRKVRRVYAQNAQRMGDAVSEYFPTGTKVTRPAGGYVLWVEMPDGTDALQLYRQARAAGISILPGPIFSPRKQFLNCIRLNAADWSEKIEGAIATLGEIAGSKTSAGRPYNG